MDREKKILEFLNTTQDNLTKYKVPLSEICHHIYKNNYYSSDHEKEIIEILNKLERLKLINRVEPKAKPQSALYYLTYKGFNQQNKISR